MNKSRRLWLRKLIKEINTVYDDDDLKGCIDTLENILDDEQNYYDNIPENLQYSQCAETSEEAINNIEEALECLNEALNCDDKYEFMSCIREAVDYIDNATF
jgi:predicted RNase H-like HicB family nuclease